MAEDLDTWRNISLEQLKWSKCRIFSFIGTLAEFNSENKQGLTMIFKEPNL